MNLAEAHEGEEYIVKDVAAEDEELGWDCPENR